jgi:hypothetical protein
MTALRRIIRRNRMMHAELNRERSLTLYNAGSPRINHPNTDDTDSQQRPR